MATVGFKQITFGISENRDYINKHLYGLDENGRVWEYDYGYDNWVALGMETQEN